MPIDYAEARRLSAKFTGTLISKRPEPKDTKPKINPLGVCAQEAHKRILYAMDKEDWLSAAMVGEMLTMHPTTARDHLNHIESTGKLESRVVRRGPFNHAVKEWRMKR